MYRQNWLRYKQLINIVFLLFTPAIYAAPIPLLYQWTIDEEAFVIVNIRVNGRSAVSDMEAYYTANNRLLLPVNALSSTMGLSLKIENNILTASINENTPVHETRLLSPTLNNQDALWATDDYDHYIDLAVLNALLDTNSQFNYSLLQLSFLSPNIKLPKQQAELLSKKKKAEVHYEHYINDEYHILTPPITEYAYSSSYRSRDESYKHSLRLNSYFDLLHHQAELRLNQNEINATSFLKINKDFNLTEEDNSFARLHYQIGDIQSQRDQTIMPSNQGLGFYVSNSNPHSNQNFSTIVIEEPALANWTADLYRNGVFISTTESNEDNLVRFEEVETFYGTNLFEIKLFGPQGEQITRTQKYTIGNTALASGGLSYQLEYLETEKSVFGQNDIAEQDFSRSFMGSISYGLSNALTYDLQLTNLDSEYGENYISSGLSAITESGSYRLIGSKQVDAGQAFYVGYRGVITGAYHNNINLNLEYSLLDDFSSPLYIAQENMLKNRFSTSLNGRTDKVIPLNWSMRWLYEDRESQQDENTYSLGINESYINGIWSNQIIYNDQSQEITNQLYNSIDISNWKWSNSINWHLQKTRLNTLTSTLRWPQTQDSFNQTQVTYNPDASATKLIRHQYSYRHDLFNILLTGQYDNQNDWIVTLGLTGSFSFDHRHDFLIFDRPRSLNAGQIEASSFIDWNENNIFDENDEPVSETKFTGNYRWKDKQTNEAGEVLLPSSVGGQILDVDLRTLPNPYLQPVLGKIKVLAHRGGITEVEIPLVIYNEVEGTIYVAKGDKTKPSAGIKVILKNIKTGKQYTTITEYDGYYYFERVSHGEYSIEVDPSALTTEKLLARNIPNKIQTSKIGDTLILKDIILYSDSSPVKNKENRNYFVHLGVFKYFENALNLTEKLSNKKYPLHFYKHQDRKNYYLVAGPYSSAQKAQEVINQVYVIPDTFGSFMVDERRYQDQQWQVIGSWQNEENTVKSNYYFCQYAAYSSNKSVEDLVKNPLDELFIVNRKVKGESRYLLLSTPYQYNGQQVCDSDISREIDEPWAPIKRPWRSIIQ